MSTVYTEKKVNQQSKTNLNEAKKSEHFLDNQLFCIQYVDNSKQKNHFDILIIHKVK